MVAVQLVGYFGTCLINLDRLPSASDQCRYGVGPTFPDGVSTDACYGGMNTCRVHLMNVFAIDLGLQRFWQAD